MGLIYSEDYEKHETGVHPENKKRVRVIINSLRNEGILDKINVLSPEIATEEDLLRVHSPAHVEYIKSLSKSGGGYVDFDTVVSPDTYEIAKLSAGGAITASKFVLYDHKSA